MKNAFDYQYHPNSHAKLYKFFDENFIGFDSLGDPIIDVDTVSQNIVIYNGKDCEINVPVFDKYVWSGLDMHNQPYYDKAEDYLYFNRKNFCDNYRNFVKSQSVEEYYDKVFADTNGIPVFDSTKGKYTDYINENFYEFMGIPLGFDRNGQIIIVDLNSGDFILDYQNDFPIWNNFSLTVENNTPFYQDKKMYPFNNPYQNSWKPFNLFKKPAVMSKKERERKNKQFKQKILASIEISNPVKNNKTEIINPLLQDEGLRFNPEENFLDVSNKEWNTRYAKSLQGTVHIKNNTVCQDNSIVFSGKNGTQQYQVLIVSDGAGSSLLSEQGSKTLVKGLKRFVVSVFGTIYQPVVAKELPSEEDLNNAKMATIKHAIGLIQDLAEENKRNIDDYNATLLFAVVGSKNTFWLRVGDGGLVVQYAYEDEEGKKCFAFQAVGEQDKSKGEFANQTYFINTALPVTHIQSSYFSNNFVSGIALMTDGVSDRLISADNSVVSSAINNLFDNEDEFVQLIQSDRFKNNITVNRETGESKEMLGHNGDDCSFAVVSRGKDKVNPFDSIPVIKNPFTMTKNFFLSK